MEGMKKRQIAEGITSILDCEHWARKIWKITLFFWRDEKVNLDLPGSHSLRVDNKVHSCKLLLGKCKRTWGHCKLNLEGNWKIHHISQLISTNIHPVPIHMGIGFEQ
jgi:hypothetical protein